MTAEQLNEMNDKFEDIEHEQFGEDGFEDAVKQIARSRPVLDLLTSRGSRRRRRQRSESSR